MKKTNVLLLSCVMLVMIFNVSCNTKEDEPVKGVESSVNETGDVKAVKITAPKANVTVGCDPNSQVLQSVNKNANFNVLNKVNNDWYAVQMSNNQIGFVPQGQCTPVTPQQPNAPDTNVSDGGGNPSKTPSTGGGTIPTPSGNGNGNGNGTPAPNNATGKTPTDNDNVANSDKNTTTNQSISSSEQQMINLVNQSRAQNDLPALQSDNQLSEIARIKSKDMIDGNYFSHNSPTHGSPFDMLKNFGVSYIKAGENIAGNQTVEKAHEALMNSSGHRQNILSSEYTHIGIGIQEGGQYGNMFTQMFIQK